MFKAKYDNKQKVAKITKITVVMMMSLMKSSVKVLKEKILNITYIKCGKLLYIDFYVLFS